MVSDPQETSRPRFCPYPRVDELLEKTRERAATLAKNSKPLAAILPKKRRLHTIADAPNFSSPLPLNPDFSRLAENKSISRKRMGSVTFSELEWLEGCFKALLESNSYALWLMSGLLSQLKRDGFTPSDPTLFDSAISSISCVLANQTDSVAAMSDFIVSKWRESYLAHVSLPISAAQKHELLVTLGLWPEFYISFIHSSWSGWDPVTHCFHKIFSRRFRVRLRRTPSSPPYRWPNSHVLSLSRGKSSSSSRTASSSRGASSSGFSSPLDYGRASPSSSYGKRSASPSHRGGGKRSKGGRGMSPSVKSHQGFWK